MNFFIKLSMQNYEGYTTGEITIHRDPSRIEGQWYARVPLNRPNDPKEPIFRKLLARENSLEITLHGPRTVSSTRKIIEELERRGISTTTLRIKPYQS